MKCILLLVFAGIILINTGCNFNSGEKNDQNTPLIWNTLTIRSEGSTIVRINNYDDTSTIISYPIVTIFSPRPKGKLKPDTVKGYFTMAEKDTLFTLAKDLILNPAKTKGACTEYIGHLELFIDYGQFKQSGEYNSVCDWNKLSDKTMKLHDILRRKIKGVYLGEDNPK